MNFAKFLGSLQGRKKFYCTTIGLGGLFSVDYQLISGLIFLIGFNQIRKQGSKVVKMMDSLDTEFLILTADNILLEFGGCEINVKILSLKQMTLISKVNMILKESRQLSLNQFFAPKKKKSKQIHLEYKIFILFLRRKRLDVTVNHVGPSVDNPYLFLFTIFTISVTFRFKSNTKLAPQTIIFK